jgi:aspartyl aminopeptidase
MYVTLFPCNECVKVIVQAGIKEVIYLSDKYAESDSTIVSKKILDSVGIKYRKYEPTNKHVLNQGFAIKAACDQSDATDSETIAIIQQICEKEGIAYKKFLKHSDEVGGGTLGSIVSAMLPIRTADIGVPLLAMHSSSETMGVKDYEALVDYMTAFYKL